MSMSSVFARVVAVIGGAALQWRQLQGAAPAACLGQQRGRPGGEAAGRAADAEDADGQGMERRAEAGGSTWAQGQCVCDRPETSALDRGAAQRRRAGRRVAQVAGPVRSVFGYAMQARCGAPPPSAKAPTASRLLRDADGDGVAEKREVFMEGLNQPFGMALVGDTFYVGNTDGVVAFPYTAGADRITASGRKLVTFKPGGHWTRSLLPSPDGRKLYVGVGSLSNIADNGMEVEEGRAAIYELDLASGTSRIFAGGLRNAVGMAWEPQTGVLWTVVNERDGLGDETPPDYLTSVRDGGFYGWPYCYWGQTVDDRVPQDPAAVAKAIKPDYALGGHTASLGLCWLPAGTLPGFPDGMAIGQHGSWNRSTLSGYKVVFVPFANGRPSGPPRDILSGFLAPDERASYGRPVGVTLGPDGSLLVADDVGDVIWRVTGA